MYNRTSLQTIAPILNLSANHSSHSKSLCEPCHLSSNHSGPPWHSVCMLSYYTIQNPATPLSRAISSIMSVDKGSGHRHTHESRTLHARLSLLVLALQLFGTSNVFGKRFFQLAVCVVHVVVEDHNVKLAVRRAWGRYGSVRKEGSVPEGDEARDSA